MSDTSTQSPPPPPPPPPSQTPKIDTQQESKENTEDNSAAILADIQSPQELTSYVETVLPQLQTKFGDLSEKLFEKMDEMSSPTSFVNTNVSNESIPASPIASEHHVDNPVIVVTTENTPTQESKEKTSDGDKGCTKACRSMLKRSKRVFEIITYFRLVIALALYALIAIDLISIRRKSEKRFWVEVITQVINAEFTLLTVLSHPNRIMNFPRAIKIYIASRNINYQQSELFTPDIKKLQISVHKSYDWYLYEATRADLICSPRKLLIVLFFWNIGSLAQYGISVILWFFSQRERPADIYTALNATAIICEVLPILLVVGQYRKAKKSKKLGNRRSSIR